MGQSHAVNKKKAPLPVEGMLQKALLGKAAAGKVPGHWSEYTGKQQALEMVRRMAGSKELREKLLLHGL